MHIKLSPEVVKDLKKIKQKNVKLSSRIQKQLYLFSINLKHPSLRTHKLNSSMNNLWSISIIMSIRMVYKLLSEDKAYFIKIGTHDEVYN
nr:type II toxin-antitoxin system mRNA interferase toxin, RelE/StbE family [Candidatus Levybacteria bacterium]